MDSDYDLIPFDPSQGIAFKYGTIYSDPAQEIAAFEKHHGIRLPTDFVRMIAKHRANFMDESANLIRFPFGRAYCGTDESEVAGHLAFDLCDSMAIVFVPIEGSPSRRIADTFEKMMHNAALEFYD